MNLDSKFRYWIWFAILVAVSANTLANTYILPPEDQNVIGTVKTVEATHEDTLLDIARHYDIGQNEIVAANPGVDRWLPGDKTRVLIPSRFILPDTPRKGIVLNVPEMRLFYYTDTKRVDKAVVTTHPVSIGRMDWNTPLGNTKVIAKQKDPAWRPPESIKEEHAADGDPLPDVVPPGPDNPLGGYAMRLNIPGYLIHSTNKPFGIGMRVTHGCVRMYPKDIEKLFDKVGIGTPVQILNQPIKVGWLMDTLYIEVHSNLEENKMSYDELLSEALNLIENNSQLRTTKIDGYALRNALQQRDGIPVAIARKTDSP